jgi:hypothetical protein
MTGNIHNNSLSLSCDGARAPALTSQKEGNTMCVLRFVEDCEITVITDVDENETPITTVERYRADDELYAQICGRQNGDIEVQFEDGGVSFIHDCLVKIL